MALRLSWCKGCE